MSINKKEYVDNVCVMTSELRKLYALTVIIFFSLGAIKGTAQPVYQIQKPVLTGVMMGASATGLLITTLVERNVPPLTSGQLSSLSLQGVNSLDRAMTRDIYNKNWDTTTDVLSLLNFAPPVAHFIFEKSRKEYGQLIVIFSETVLYTQLLTQVAKVTALRTRPYMYNAQALYGNTDAESRLSFFSGHTSTFTSVSFLTAATLSDFGLVEGPAKIITWTGAALLPLVMGYGRMAAGKHFFTDVLTGYAVGAITGMLVPHLHKAIK